MEGKKSRKIPSKTEQTGTFYTAGFSSGFIQQNKAKIVNGKWTGDEILVQRRIKKKTRKGKFIEERIGDVDFLCRTNIDTPLPELFPVGSRCDTSKIPVVPAATDIYIEVTSMSGEHAMELKDNKGKTKVQSKIEFYEQLFTESNLIHDSVMDLRYEKKSCYSCTMVPILLN